MSPIRPPVAVVGRRGQAADHRLRDFLTRIAQPFEWLEAGTDEARALLAARDAEDAALPVLVDGGETMAGATVEHLVQAWHMNPPPSRSAYDLAIVGAGPAGLAAAVYAASDGLSTLLLEHDVPGGQASHTSKIENFFGFPDGIGGAELARRAGRQAERFGAELLVMRGLESSRPSGDGGFELDVAGGHRVHAAAVIAAPGMIWRHLDVEGVDDLLGRGVYYGAGRSEAAHCAGEHAVVVGAGNSAGQAVMHLADAGARVTMLVRGEALARSMSAYLVERIAGHASIDVRLRTELHAVDADERGLAAVVAAERGRAPERLPARALFLCLGGVPRTGWAPEAGVELDAGGFVRTGPNLVETRVPGLFVAGDARSGSPKRVASAVGDGATAVALVHRRLEAR